MTERVTFRPMDPDRDSALLVTFGRDLITVNFGSAARFSERFGDDGLGYVAWIGGLLAANADAAQFACLAGEPVGMIIVGAWADDPAEGYIHHLYLTPAWRGRGLGRHPEGRALAALRAAGFSRIRLSAAPANRQAWHFYRALGWTDAGPRDGVPDVRYLEKTI